MKTIYRSTSSAEVVDEATLTEEIEAARKHLAAAIEAKGEDYVYLSDPTQANKDTCLYLNYESVEWIDEGDDCGYVYESPRGPSCIVGHVLVGMEVPFDQITEVEGDRAEKAITALDTFKSYIVKEALDKAQQRQDNPSGFTWGSAVEEFEAYITEHTIKVQVDD